MRGGVVFLAVVGACSGGSLRAPIDAGSSSFARFRITLSIPRDGDPTINGDARLLRYRDLDADSAQVLAGGAGSSDSLPIGRCARVDGEALLEDTLGAAPADAAIDMLDAGDVVISLGGKSVRLLPRFAPQPLPFVAGVVYESDGEDATSPSVLRAATISAAGGTDVDRFDATATVPAASRFTSIDAQDPSGLALRWNDADATVLIGLASPAGEVRCRATGGSFSVPRTLVPAGPLTLTLERTARTPFHVAGLSAAEIDVAVRDVVTLP
jgi:hypothetical protein